MTAHSTHSIEIKDLRHVSVQCQHCHSRLGVDLDAPGTEPRALAGRLLPSTCPVCEKAFDSALKLLLQWREAYQGLKNVPGVQVEIAQDA